MRGVFPDVLPVLPRILLGPRLGLGAVLVEDRVGGVEHPLEAGNFLEQLDAVLPTHAAVVHAVFVNGLQALIEEAHGDFAQSLEDELGCFVGIVGWLKAHDAYELGAEALHARDGAVDLGDGDVPRRVDGLGPVANGRAEGVNADAGLLELGCYDVECRIRDVVNAALVEAVHLDEAGLDPFPAKLFGGPDLAVDRGRSLVCNSH